MEGIITIINSVGFPAACCVGLAVYCKLLMQNTNDTYKRIFDLYEKANNENRRAIEDLSKAIDALCDKLDRMN